MIESWHTWHGPGFLVWQSLMVASTLATVANMYSTQKNSMTISLTVNMWHKTTQLEALLDCGATHNFIDPLLRSCGMFGSTWAGWLRLRCLAHCTWSLRFRYSVRANGSWVYGWYRAARAWEISQVYKVFRGDLYVPHFKTRLIRELRPKV